MILSYGTACIVFTACSFLKYWAGLYKEDEKKAIVAGADQLTKMALDVAKSGTRADGSRVAEDDGVVLLRITAG